MSMGNSEFNFNQLEGQLLYTNEEFIPSNQEIILVTRDDDGKILTSETLSPSLGIKLENNLPSPLKTLIFEKEGSEELSATLLIIILGDCISKLNKLTLKKYIPNNQFQ